MSDYITIDNEKYPVESKLIEVRELLFWDENPRVYSVLNLNSEKPTQGEIQEHMCSLESVRELVLQIKSNGGLIDPVIVRGSSNVVIEGNSRLAAYRILAERDPIEWATMKCTILPDNISDSAIMTLIGQYHIVGKTDWTPFEQSGYLYRSVNGSSKSIETIANILGMKHAEAKRSYEVYKTMIETDDTKRDHFSYYDEFFKNSSLKEFRSTTPIDEVIFKQIKNDEIKKALDIRDKLGAVAKIKDKEAKKLINSIINEEITIYDAFETVENSGKTGDTYHQLKKFRQKICSKDYLNTISPNELQNVDFELKKIKSATEKWLKKLEGKSW